MADKTFNLKVVGSMRDLKGLLEGSLTSFRIPDGVTSLHQYGFYNFPQLTDLDFNQVEIIPSYCCYQSPSLTRVVFSNHTTEIGEQAFRECSKLTQVVFPTYITKIGEYAFNGCTKLDITELPHTLTRVDRYAFYNAGSSYDRGTHTFTMINNAGVYTSIDYQAFCQSHLSEITAYLKNVSESAFSNCASLTKVDVEIHGVLQNYAFHGCQYVMDFKINPNSVIEYLGYSVFQYLGSKTYLDTNFHMADFDFRNSIFTSLPRDLWGYCRFNGIAYFPFTLNKIEGSFMNNAYGNWITYFNSIPSVSSSSYLRDDSSDTFTVKYAFPYTQLDTALVTTNWSSHTSQIVGYGTGFEAGTTLPAYRRDTGVGITWYSDVAMTTPVTTSSSATDTYYCSLGSTRLVWFVDTPFLADASITISDGVNTYSAGDPVPVNTSLTIIQNYTDPTKDRLYLFEVNGTDYTSTGSASITMTQDLSVIALYWDGTDLPLLPTLSDNTWEKIKIASRNNFIPPTWHIGDTKTFTYNGETYTARLVDKTGKYKRASDDSTAYLSFEAIELLPNYSYSSSNVNQSNALIDMNSGTIWDNMDADLKSVLETVKVQVSQGGGSSTQDTIIDWEGKLFLPREHDLFSIKRRYSVQAEWDLITQDQYYQANDTNTARLKRMKSSSSGGEVYWLMSPSYRASNEICTVWSDGTSFSAVSYYERRIAVRFAL